MLTAMKAVINDTVIKASFPIGTIHEYNGVRYKKEAPGKWVPIYEGKAADHPVEKDRQSKHDAIKKELVARKDGKQVLPATERTKQANQKLDAISQRERDLSTKDAELSQRETDHRERQLDLREAKLGKKPEKKSPKPKAEAKPKDTKAEPAPRAAGFGKELEKRNKEKLEQAKSDVAKKGVMSESEIEKAGSTKKFYQNDKGEYLPERKALHESIIKARLDHIPKIPPPSGDRPVMILSGGGSGSGKTQCIKEARKEHTMMLALVDADDIKNDLPEYNDMIKRGDDKAAFVSHDESSDIAMELIKRAMEQQKPFVYDGTMKSPDKYISLINDARKYKLGIHAAFADLPVDKCIERAEQRFKTEGGRKVPESIIRESNEKAKSTLQQIESLLDSSVTYDTDVPMGSPPKIKFVMHSLSKAGEMNQIKDSQLYQDFLESLTKIKPSTKDLLSNGSDFDRLDDSDGKPITYAKEGKVNREKNSTD
jgi:predicted ABC-type ATPase